MPRRKKDSGIWTVAPQLLGLFILVCVFNPSIRQAIAGIWLYLAVAVAGLGACIVLFWSERKSPFSSNSQKLNVFAPVADLAPGASTTDHSDLPDISFFPVPAKGLDRTAQHMERLRAIDWFQFERLVGLAYRKLGYNISRRGGANPDGGIDLVISKDGKTSAVQCKHWRNRDVGVRYVREFLGALMDAKIQHGIFVTLSGYTGDAKQLAEKHGIEILNETGFTQLLKSSGVMSSPEAEDILSDQRKLCPKCEREMVLRTSTRGPNAGSQFWGCSGYPKCRCIVQVSYGEPHQELTSAQK